MGRPWSAANRSAPSPASRQCGERVRIASAIVTALASAGAAASAPMERSAPHIVAASASSAPSRLRQLPRPALNDPERSITDTARVTASMALLPASSRAPASRAASPRPTR